MNQLWRVYIILCENNSHYTGVSTDYLRRFKEHSTGKGAKFFRIAKPVKFLWVSEEMDKSKAFRLEAHLKSGTRSRRIEILRERGVSEVELEQLLVHT